MTTPNPNAPENTGAGDEPKEPLHPRTPDDDQVTKHPLSDSEILSEAQNLPESLRAEYIRSQCSGDALRTAVLINQLNELERSSGADKSMFGPLVAPPKSGAQLSSNTPPPSRRVGNFVLGEFLGKGGFGSVFKAHHAEVPEQYAAVKIMQESRSPHDNQRFERECSILATCTHPNIARFMDRGITEKGERYIIQEYADSGTITEYATKNKLTINDRLRLFIGVCEALEYAHTPKINIIHCDLNPRNILVTRSSDTPTAKVIDFGIARLSKGGQLSIASQERSGQFAGTLDYMAPEQMNPNNTPDARMDIYALGLVLFELIAGVYPFDRTAINSCKPDDLADFIRTQPPPRASERVRQLMPGSAVSHSPPAQQSGQRQQQSELASLGDLANERGISEAEFVRVLRDDLDYLLLRAIDPDRRNRFATVTELKHDIERFLRFEPMRCRPRTFSYVFRKFCKRQPGLTVTIAAAASVAVGIGLVAWQQSQASNRRYLQQEQIIQVLRPMIDRLTDPEAPEKVDSKEMILFVEKLGELQLDLPIAPLLTVLPARGLMAQGEYARARETIDRLLKQPDLSSEVRIEAFVTAARCAASQVDRDGAIAYAKGAEAELESLQGPEHDELAARAAIAKMEALLVEDPNVADQAASEGEATRTGLAAIERLKRPNPDERLICILEARLAAVAIYSDPQKVADELTKLIPDMPRALGDLTPAAAARNRNIIRAKSSLAAAQLKLGDYPAVVKGVEKFHAEAAAAYGKSHQFTLLPLLYSAMAQLALAEGTAADRDWAESFLPSLAAAKAADNSEQSDGPTMNFYNFVDSNWPSFDASKDILPELKWTFGKIRADSFVMRNQKKAAELLLDQGIKELQAAKRPRLDVLSELIVRRAAVEETCFQAQKMFNSFDVGALPLRAKVMYYYFGAKLITCDEAQGRRQERFKMAESLAKGLGETDPLRAALDELHTQFLLRAPKQLSETPPASERSSLSDRPNRTNRVD